MRQLSEQKNTSDQLEGSLDKGLDSLAAAKGMVDAARGIGTAAAEAGTSAASSAASSGAGAGAASGTGAAAGTAAGGPAGTVLGAVAGLAVGLLMKPLVKAFIVLAAVIVLVFTSLPSMFWEKPVDVADNTGPLEVYVQYRDYVGGKYLETLDTQKQSIEEEFAQRIADGEFEDYDRVEFTYSFIPPEEEFLLQLADSYVLIVSMFEISTDDWRKATFADFMDAVDSVSITDSLITRALEDETQEAEREEGEKVLYVHAEYLLTDIGVEAFRGLFQLDDDREYLKAVEMSYNTRLYFGEIDELPMGGVTGGDSGESVPGGGSAGSYPGGGTHNTIRQALNALEEQPEFYGGSAIIPISSYHRISSEFGPRNYAPDPIHTGIDFSADAGTPIYAAMDGVVLLRLTNAQSFGHHIVLYHGGNITTMYAHMNTFGAYQVGDSVRRGDVIGYVGKTGLSTGNHLHFVRP